MSCPYHQAPSSPTDDDSIAVSQPQQQTLVPIPQPPTTFLLGNFRDLDPNYPARSTQRLAELYGEIYQLDLQSRVIVVSSQKLANEVCDENRFHKDIQRALLELRTLIGDGLFTGAHTDGAILKNEPNWWKAHRMLVPAFGPLGIRNMFDNMLDISSQMVQRLDRMGEDHAVNCADDFTRLAFDTIGLCAFGFRFNEFYTDAAHPFAQQMSNVLKLSGRRANRSDLENKIHYWEEQNRQADVKAMHELATKVVEERKSHPQPGAKDLLNTMLNGVDRETGESLSQENIVYNMVTFLVAGHETTSATLSFLWYNLLKNPEKFHKAQKQVDEVLGDNVITPEMIPKLTYLDACIKETLRLSSPISSISVRAKDKTTLANGKYYVDKGDFITVNIKGVHNDPAVWGHNTQDFEPERFLDGGFEALPPHSWLPFGRGLRACIGRVFAEQEMILNTAMMLQKFSPEMADPGYELRIRATLTIKPDGFFMKVRRRPGKTLQTGIPGSATTSQTRTSKPQHHALTDNEKALPSPRIFFGGNAGTCEGLAQMLQTKLDEYGVHSEISNLDSATEGLRKDTISLIIASSYEGKPADNSKKFVSWLERLNDNDELTGAKYATFGVGSRDWPNTLHRIPKLIDEKLQQLGAQQLTGASFADVKSDLIGPFEDWAEAVVEALKGDQEGETKQSLRVNVDKSTYVKSLEEEKIAAGVVIENTQLADASVGAAKRHMEIRMPDEVSYQAGDYLAVQPKNPSEAVQRVLRYYGFDESTHISISGSKKTYLPREPTSVGTFLYDYVELGTPVTRRQLKTIADSATGSQKQQLEELQSDDAAWATVLQNRYSIMDILEEYTPDLPFEVFVDMLLPLTPRQYSVSSSPVQGHENIVSITYDVHSSPALSGHGMFDGVCSSFLAGRKQGDRIYCFIRPNNVNFRLPKIPETPIMMCAAGTGIAPMRAFLQERAAIAAAGSLKLGPALLFFGCRDEEQDFLYKTQLREWEEKGIVTVFPAYSRSHKADQPKYVQDAIWEQRELCSKLFSEGGKIYLCGSAARLGQSCAEVCKKVWREYTGRGEGEAQEWLDSVKTDRYISDVY